MAKHRGKKRKFNKKDYDWLDAVNSSGRASQIASRERRQGNRVIIDPGKHKGKDAYHIYIRQGARDK